MRRVWLVAACALSLGAQDSLVDKLLATADTDSVEHLLDAEAAQVTPELFESCRKAALAHYEKRENAEALQDYQTALAVARHLHSDRLTAMALRGSGMCWFRMDQPAKALKDDEDGLVCARKAQERALEAELLRGAGTAHRRLGHFGEAIQADEQSLAIYRELNNTLETARALNNLGSNYNLIGDLRRSWEIWEEAITIGKDHQDLVDFVANNLALIAADLGNTDAAIKFFEQALGGSEKKQDAHGIAVGLNNLGPVYRERGETDKALESYNRALALVPGTHDLRLESTILINRAALYNGTGRATLALKDLRESAQINQQIDAKETYATALTNLAWIELGLKQTEAGCEHARQAMAVSDQYGESTYIRWQALDALGQCSMAQGDREGGRKNFQDAVEAVEALRSLAGGNGTEAAGFLQARIQPYHDLIRLDVAEGLTAQALGFAERAKARELLDVVRGAKPNGVDALSPEEQEQERQLGVRISEAQQRLQGAKDGKTRSAAEVRLGRAQREMEAFRMNAYMAHPSLTAPAGEAHPITVAEAGSLLPNPQTAIVEFTSTEKELFAFTLRRGANGRTLLRAHTMPWPRKQLERDVNEFLSSLAARDVGYRAIGERLYRRLLGPLAADLGEAQLMVIVPDGPLWNLPFQALVRPDGRHLIEQQALFYAPSLTYLRARRDMRGGDGGSGHRLLALGDPDTQDIPETAREVRELVDLYGPESSKALTGVEALKANWQRAAPQYRILHIATHGVLNEKNPMYSYLVFSGKTSSEKILEARDVMNMNLRPAVVVLSACETARGKVTAGEGLVGMSWAFLLAGAPTTVVSQWKTDSASTTQLMINMHRLLKPALTSSHGMGRAVGLQQAALEVMKMPEYKHPFYWAGFVMIGDGY